MSNYNNRFQNSEGYPMDPMARALELAGPLPKTFGTAETLGEKDDVQYTSQMRNPEWNSPKDSVIKREPLPQQ